MRSQRNRGLIGRFLQSARVKGFALLLSLTLPAAHAADERTQRQFALLFKECAEMTAGGLTARDDSFRGSLIAGVRMRLAQAQKSQEAMLTTAEQLRPAELAMARGRRPSLPPPISRQTMQALLAAYGDQASLISFRGELMRAAREALESDPYFAWLKQQQGQQPSSEASSDFDGITVEFISPYGRQTTDPATDPIKYFLDVLDVGGPARLPLSLAIWRLRAKMDPTLSPLSLSIISTALLLRRHAYLLQDILTRLEQMPPDAEIWSFARDLAHARSERRRLLSEVVANAGAAFSRSLYEKMKAFFAEESPDTEILRRYILATDGILKGKLSESDMEILAREGERIRLEAGFPDTLKLDSTFLKLWPLVWGQQMSYEMVLVREFYSGDATQLETLLRNLELLITVGQAMTSDDAFREFIQDLTDRNAGRFR